MHAPSEPPSAVPQSFNPQDQAIAQLRALDGLAPADPQQAQALQALPNIIAQLASLYESQAPLVAALDTIDAEIKRVLTAGQQAMSACGARHFETADAKLELKAKVVYNATDWPAIQKHVQETGEFDLLQRRLSSTAVRQRTTLPPGIMQATFDEPHFSVVKGKR